MVNRRNSTYNIRFYPDSFVHVSRKLLTFGSSRWSLSSDALRSLNIKNAGGNSNVSEMMSIELYSRVFDATDFLYEMEIDYRYEYNMVDYLCTIDGARIGISVTRAMGYPTETSFDAAAATRLLRKKLHGLIIARNSVNKKHSFFRSILHIWCQSARIAQLVRVAYRALDVAETGLDVKGFLVLHLTVCSDSYIYTNSFP